jgi:glyoxylase-like metal-dependent hydrolase (beta-lactamase superfamily II)
MHRRRFLTTTGMLAGAGLAATVLPLPTAAFSPSTGLFTPIRRGTGRFESRGGTIGWLVNDDAVVAVDSQFPESATECRDGLNERSGRTIDLLINSHHHGDHTAGNGVLGADADHIVAHDNVPMLQRMQAEQRGTLDDQTYADVTFAETWSQDVGDETIKLYHFGPAHTGGDAIIHFEKADVVHMGDLVFNYRHAYIDLGAGADTANWMTVLERAYDLFSDNTVFVFGHGNPANGVLGRREDVLVMRDYLGALRDAATAGIDAGHSAEETAAKGLEGFDGHIVGGNTNGIAGNIATVYEEMTTVKE